MTIHVIHWEDTTGDLVDIDYQCSWACMVEQLDNVDAIRELPTTAGDFTTPTGVQGSYGAWPCGDETDYDVYCSNCEALLWKGLDNDTQ